MGSMLSVAKCDPEIQSLWVQNHVPTNEAVRAQLAVVLFPVTGDVFFCFLNTKWYVQWYSDDVITKS